jgi:hypothetical protein
MHRGRAVVVLGAYWAGWGCAFHPGPAPESTPDSRAPNTVDAAADASTTECDGKVWLADFSVDPTTIDLNADGILDFAMRDGSALGGTLADDVWAQATTGDIRPLDTEPKQTFMTRTLVHVRMADTMVPPVGGYGAVFWINVGYDGSNMAPLYVDAELQADGQTQNAILYGKTDGGTAAPLLTVNGLAAGMHDYYLDIDPIGHVVGFQVDSATSTQEPFPYFAADGNTDQWASIDAWSNTTATYGYERVEACPP